jgi:hypothetical protein
MNQRVLFQAFAAFIALAHDSSMDGFRWSNALMPMGCGYGSTPLMVQLNRSSVATDGFTDTTSARLKQCAYDGGPAIAAHVD